MVKTKRVLLVLVLVLSCSPIMALDLNLSGQQTAVDQIAPKIQQFKNQMDLRKPVWDKLPDSKKKKWITSGKDPIMTTAWQIYKYLRNNFFTEQEGWDA